jgi:hypothetical protein
VEADRGDAAREHRLGGQLALTRPADAGTLEIARLDGDVLVLDGLGLARASFDGDDSSYDSLAGTGARDRIETADVHAINRWARARSPHGAWASIVDRPLSWLAAIDPDLDLIEASDARWRRERGEELVRAALADVVAARRGMAVATKLLHLKRPRLFPLLDEYVAVMLGRSVPATPERKLDTAIELVLHLRREGRRNLEPLTRIQAALAGDSRRSLVRILDAVIWFSHPAAHLRGVERVLRVDRIAR